jgi:hypothetical protein
MREDRAIGAFALWRTEPRGFTAKQVALVKTFADQAAIAIENVRLFNETREALEQQQASAEVLRVISGSVADTAPVFERIAECCKRLFDGSGVRINLVGEDGMIHVGYYDGPNPEQFRRVFPVPLSAESSTGRAVLERRIVHYPDIEHGDDVPEYTRRSSEATGEKSLLFAPMLWEGSRGIGASWSREGSRERFRKGDRAPKTFADQAVICHPEAPLQRDKGGARAANGDRGNPARHLSSPTDMQPVLEAIADRAARCAMRRRRRCT